MQAGIERKVTVAEVTFCNGISVAEHVVLMILSLVRDYLPSYKWVSDGGWNIADCVERSYDLELMDVGTIAAGESIWPCCVAKETVRCQESNYFLGVSTEQRRQVDRQVQIT